MKATNIFDDVMNYIDENIKCKYSDVKDGIYSNFAYTDMDFNKFLSIATRGAKTLNKYFIRRKLYYISKELVDKPDVPIIDIAYDFSYTEQSSLNRDMRKHYSTTPNEIRKSRVYLPDEKMKFEDFDVNKYEWGKRLKRAIALEIDLDYPCTLCESESDYFGQFIEATKEFGFDITTCYAISEVSERISVPFGVLLNACFDLMIEYHADPNYLEPRIEKALSCDIHSEEELERICEYFDCEYYELHPFLVETYRKDVESQNDSLHK